MTALVRVAAARWWAALLLLFAAVAALPAAAAPTFPKFTGLVVDDANVLPADVKARLTQKLEALQRDTNRQLVVATIGDMQGYPLEDYGYQLGRAWAVGLKDVNNGAILFVAPNNPAGQRGPRIEVGYGLEPVLTDALSSQIINEKMMPLLKAGQLPQAMEAGTAAIIAQLRASPDEAKARTDAAIKDFNQTHQRRQSGGGGVPIGLIFWGVVLLFVIIPMFRRGARGRSYDGGSGLAQVVLWNVASEMLRDHDRGGGGGWGGGGGGDSDGGWGGGGFTGGGGGSFGGGGASGELVMRLSDQDRARVTAAVTAAEANTDGEILAMLARRSDAYHDVALHWGVLAMLLLLALLAAFPGTIAAVHAAVYGAWSGAPSIEAALTIALIAATLAFLLARVLFAWRPLRLAVTPGGTKARRVRRQALALFRAGAEKRTIAATGVLLYLSIEEHRAELIADASIHDRVAPEAWGDAMAALIAAVKDGRPADGIVEAVTRIGVVLAEHFPRSEGDTNELPDRLIEL